MQAHNIPIAVSVELYPEDIEVALDLGSAGNMYVSSVNDPFTFLSGISLFNSKQTILK